MNRAPGTQRNLPRRLPVLLYMVFLFGLSSLPGTALDPSPVPEADKVLHFMLYAGFGVLLMGLFTTSPSRFAAGNAVLLTVLAGTLYAATDEWHQSFVPGRDASCLDLLSDALGCAAAALILRRPKRSSSPPGRPPDRQGQGETS